MSRATGLFRALQRLQGAFGAEASNAMRATLSSGMLADASKELGSTGATQQQGFNTQLRLGVSNPFSFASQLHTLSRKEEQATPLASISTATQLPKAAQALSMLRPKPSHGPSLPQSRHMGGSVAMETGQGCAPAGSSDSAKVGQLQSDITEVRRLIIKAVKDGQPPDALKALRDVLSSLMADLKLLRPSQGQAGKDEVAGLTARLEQLEFQLLRSHLSVTSVSAVGRFVTEKHSRIALSEVLALLGVPVNMDAYCEELLIDPDIVKAFDAAKKSTKEPATQMLYEKLAAVANRLASPGVYACNTSNGGYPGSEKIDITVSTVPQPPKKQGSIPWTGVAGTCEVKSKIHDGGDYNIVMGQLSDRAMDCFSHQPQRAHMFGLAGGSDAAELSVFYKDQRFAVRTGREQLELAPNSKGLQLVAAFFMAPAAQLGYVAPSPLAWFTTTTVISHPQETWEVRANTLLRDSLVSGSKSTCTVWACTFSGCASGTQLDAILKVGPVALAEADTLLHLNQAGIPNIPRLLDYGAMPTGQPYLAITPVGFSVTPQTEPARFLQLGRDAAQTSEAMYRLLKLLHMDYSATNILKGPGDETLVIDFGLSHRSQRAPVFSGTINFMDIERTKTGKATLSGELESIMYVLLWWACNGRLPWKQATGFSATAAAKLYAMEKLFKEKVLSRCRPELKPAMRDLRNLLFTPAHNCNVSADAFIDVLNKHINALQHP